MATNQNPEKGPLALHCEAWEAMLTDSLDGRLEARDAEAFAAHSASCASCGELLEEAQRGSEWLRFLRETPAAPEGLLEKILAGTTGLNEAQPLVAAGAVALPSQPWLGASMSMLQRHVAESRILMTLAMAFFSIALTLNLTGVRLNQLKLSDLRPSTLASTVSHEYFTTSAHLMRYYSNLRFVYEVESRLNEMRRDTTNDRPAAQPASQPQKAQPPATGKPGGAASNGWGRKGDSAPRSEQRWSGFAAPPSVLAASPQDSELPSRSAVAHEAVASARITGHVHFSVYPVNFEPGDETPGDHKPLERSLV